LTISVLLALYEPIRTTHYVLNQQSSCQAKYTTPIIYFQRRVNMSRSSGGAEFFAGLVIGGLIGAALAILMAPQSGEETRAQIKEAGSELKHTAGESLADSRARADVIVADARQRAEQILAEARTRADEIQSQAKETVSRVAQRGQTEASNGDA
jgi:gas vesicle protein